jgi:uncharacterized membrane protein
MKVIPGKIQRFLKNSYVNITNSIAFYPILIMLVFLILSYLSISFDFSEKGKTLKSQIGWLRLKDSSTARVIAASIVTGIISLTVFSFTMVMIVLNQTASQMSNRILDNIISSRFQQIVLGIYIGTIIYALFLLSTIRNVDSGIHIPSLSTYFLILLTIIDLFVFIYFLHYITQSVRYEVIIRKTHNQTRVSMQKYCSVEKEPSDHTYPENGYPIKANRSGIYTGFGKRVLLKLCMDHDFTIRIPLIPGTFILKGTTLIESSVQLNGDIKKKVYDALFIGNSETIDENYLYGFRQLSEVAVKALSPGINDPGTAILSLRAIFSLLIFKSCHFHDNIIMDDNHCARIFTRELSFENLFSDTVFPIWDYGRKDMMIRHEPGLLLTQLNSMAPNSAVKYLLEDLRQVQ